MAALLDSGQFSRSMSGEAGFWRCLISEPGFEVTHNRRNSAGDYDMPGTISHCVTVQCSAQNRYRTRLGGHLNEGRGLRGMSWVKPAGVAVAMEWTQPVEVLNLWITPALVDDVLQEPTVPGASALSPRFVSVDPLVEQIAMALKTGSEARHPLGRLLRDSLVATLVTHLAIQAAPRVAATVPTRAGLVEWRLRRVIDYMEDRYAQNLSLKELAAVADLSQHHFADSFRKAMGRPPHRYLLERRIERAKAMFNADRRLPVVDAAVAVGFATSAHFATMFRKLTGQTPSAYRDQA